MSDGAVLERVAGSLADGTRATVAGRGASADQVSGPERPVPLAAPASFAGFLSDSAARASTRRVWRWTLVPSIAFHMVMVGAGAVYSYWQVEELSAPAVAVTFLTRAATPPPPPPAARTQVAREKAHRRLPSSSIRAVVAPVAEPPPEPVPLEETEDSVDAEGGAAEGMAGGVQEGVAGGVVSDAPPLPPAQPEGLPPQERALLLDRYLKELFRSRIASQFRYPPEAERLGIEGTVVVRVSIDRMGKLLEARLAGVCPHDILCDAAAKAVRQAAPFPPPPPQLGGSIQIDVPLSYRLE